MIVELAPQSLVVETKGSGLVLTPWLLAHGFTSWLSMPAVRRWMVAIGMKQTLGLFS